MNSTAICRNSEFSTALSKPKTFLPWSGQSNFRSMLHAVGKEKIKSGVWVRNYPLFCIFNGPGMSNLISLSDRLPLSRDYKWTWHRSKHVTVSRLTSAKLMVGGRAMRCIGPVWPSQKILWQENKCHAFSVSEKGFEWAGQEPILVLHKVQPQELLLPSHAPLNTCQWNCECQAKISLSPDFAARRSGNNPIT